MKVEGAFGTIERHGKTIYPLDAKVEQGGPFSWECNEAFAVGDYIVGRCIKPPADSNTVQTKYFVIDARDPALLSSEDPADYLHEFTELHDLERSCHQLQIELPDSLKEK